MDKRRRRGLCRFGPCLLVLLSPLTLGCLSKGEPQSVAQEAPNLVPLARLYGKFAAEHQGKGPADEAEFKEFIQSVPRDQLEQLQVDNVDSLFVSPRDQKPYVILYGGRGRGGASGPGGYGGPPVIAYEQKGKGGKRFVVTSMGAPEEVDEARFKQMVPAAAAP